MRKSPIQLDAPYRVAWEPAKVYVTMDGEIVTQFGLDALMNRYYRTKDGIYIKHGSGVWVRII